MKSNYEIVSESLMMALQDLDEPDLTKEELSKRVSTAKAKADLANSLARYQQSLVNAEKLRLTHGESKSADEMVGIASEGDGKKTYRLEARL